MTAVLFGCLLGAFVGFLARPSVMLVGQLPLDVVLTRGAMLTGLGRLLIPAARQSFNIMLSCSILGAVGGCVLSKVLVQKHASKP